MVEFGGLFEINLGPTSGVHEGGPPGESTRGVHNTLSKLTSFVKVVVCLRYTMIFSSAEFLPHSHS